MSTFKEIREERIKKTNILKDKGVNPYPVSSFKDFSVADVLSDFAKLSKKKNILSVVGRVTAVRSHGGSIFFDINDGSINSPQAGSTSIQAYIKKDEAGEEQFSLFFETLDVGDFIGVSGRLFLTKKKEKTIKVSKWTMLAKSLRPLPEKWHGLKDVEERFRKRYLDLLMSDDIKQRFFLRSKIITEIRKILNGEGFLEVETPVLQILAGGALAQPFKTHHNALDVDLYLRVAPELYLKKLLVGGFTKIYEIGKNFRNEGIDANHNPEFTMLELYEAYGDSNYLQDFTETFFKKLLKNVFDKDEIKCGENKILFSKKFA